MKKSIYVSVVLLSAFCLSSCSSAWKTINVGRVGNVELEPIKPDRYVILEEVEGYSKASGLGPAMSLMTGINKRVSKATSNADFQAISKVEGADMLLSPRYEIQTTSFLFLFSSANVKVKAKAVRIKATNEK